MRNALIIAHHKMSFSAKYNRTILRRSSLLQLNYVSSEVVIRKCVAWNNPPIDFNIILRTIDFALVERWINIINNIIIIIMRGRETKFLRFARRGVALNIRLPQQHNLLPLSARPRGVATIATIDPSIEYTHWFNRVMHVRALIKRVRKKMNPIKYDSL